MDNNERKAINAERVRDISKFNMCYALTFSIIMFCVCSSFVVYMWRPDYFHTSHNYGTLTKVFITGIAYLFFMIYLAIIHSDNSLFGLYGHIYDESENYDRTIAVDEEIQMYTYSEYTPLFMKLWIPYTDKNVPYGFRMYRKGCGVMSSAIITIIAMCVIIFISYYIADTYNHRYNTYHEYKDFCDNNSECCELKIEDEKEMLCITYAQSKQSNVCADFIKKYDNYCVKKLSSSIAIIPVLCIVSASVLMSYALYEIMTQRHQCIYSVKIERLRGDRGLPYPRRDTGQYIDGRYSETV